MTLVVVLFESSTGSSIRKGLLRLVGTLTGAAVGMAILYFVVLCNGLSHANTPQASPYHQTWHALQPFLARRRSHHPSTCPAHTWPAAEVHPDGAAAGHRVRHQRSRCRQDSWAHLHAGEPCFRPAEGCTDAQGCQLRTLAHGLTEGLILRALFDVPPAAHILHHSGGHCPGGLHSGCGAVGSGALGCPPLLLLCPSLLPATS